MNSDKIVEVFEKVVASNLLLSGVSRIPANLDLKGESWSRTNNVSPVFAIAQRKIRQTGICSLAHSLALLLRIGERSS